MLKYSIMVGTGLVSIIIGLIIFFVLATTTRSRVLDAMVINSVNHKNYQKWLNNTRADAEARYYNAYVFNLTNPLEFAQGIAKPDFAEIGPFVYRIYEAKSEVNFFEGGNKVFYRSDGWYVFDRSRSAFDDSILVTNLNPVYVAFAQQMGGGVSTGDDFLSATQRKTLQTVLGQSAKYGLLFRVNPVRQIIFGPDPLAALVGSTMQTGLISNDTTVPRYYIVYTGQDSANNGGMNKFFMYDGVNVSTRYGTGSKAVSLNGVRTASMDPFQGATPDSITMLLPTLQMVQGFTFNGVQEVESIETARYVMDSDAFTKVNARYNRTIQGFTPYQAMPPIFLSLPHMGGCSAKYTNAVTGLRYVDVSHRSFFDLESITGNPLQFSQRLQVNLFINFTATPFFDAPRVINASQQVMIPIAWFDSNFRISTSGAQKLKDTVVTAVVARRAVLGSLVGLGVVCVLIGAALMVQKGGADANASENTAATQPKPEIAPETEIPNTDDTDLQPFVPPPMVGADEVEMAPVGPKQ